MTSYLVNIIQVIHRNVAFFLRKEVNVAWFFTLLKPLQYVAQQFDDFTRQRKRQAKYNGQKMVMERMLNLYFYGQDKWATAADPTASGGFYIEQANGNVDLAYSWTNAEATQEDWSWTDAETATPQSYSWTDAELVNLNYDFIVKIPSAFIYDESEVRALVDRYKLSGKFYQIETY